MKVISADRDIFRELHEHAAVNHKLFMAEIDVTNRCNCKCAFCFQGNSHKENEHTLTFSEICALMDRLSELGCYYLSFSGGEPFCRDDFVEILDEAKKRGFYITFASQLQLATPVQIERVNAIGIEKVLVSFHSSNPKRYSEIFSVNEKYYWRALENVLRLIKGGTPTGIAVTVSNKNADDLKSTCDFFVSKGIKKEWIRFNPLLAGINSVANIRGEKILSEHLKIHPDLKINTLSTLRAERQSFLCHAGRTSCVIHPNGDVTACGFLTRVCGNIRNEDIGSIWENSPVFHSIRGITEKDLDRCKKCEHLETCQVCIGNNYNETGSYVTPSDDYCALRQELSNIFR